MGISDFRYNAFNNAMELINITDEVHVVPNNAPYQIRLSEVPSKDNPSTVSIRYYDDSVALTEVGAPPSTGQFWCDYNTENTDWNTGLIRFNSADAGKIIKISYKGTGTLASISSPRLIAWQNARGSGLLGDKICSNGEVLSGALQYRNFLVPAGITVYIAISAVIMCTGSCTILGEINGVGRGGSGVGMYCGSGGKAGANYFASGDSGPPSEGSSCICAGGAMQYTGSPSANIIDALAYEDISMFFGAAGGWGGGGSAASGKGGAGLKIVATSFVNKGTINLNGGNGGNGSYISAGKYGGGAGGGGGGALCVAASKISNTGTITAEAGSGGWNGGGGSKNGNAGYPGFVRLLEVMP